MQKGKKRDTAGLKVVSRRKYGTEADVTEYVFSVTGDEFVERTNYLQEYHFIRDSDCDYYEPLKGAKAGDYRYTRRTETRQKLLCIGGPLAGQRITDAKGYHIFNAAAFTSRLSPGGPSGAYRCVFVHASLLRG